MSASPPLYTTVGLRIGWGPAKSELVLPPGVDPDTLELPRSNDGNILLHVVEGLEACLGIPRHRRMCVDFITRAMRKPAARHDRLLLLVRGIAEDAPLTALRLLQLVQCEQVWACDLCCPPGDHSPLCGSPGCGGHQLFRDDPRVRSDRAVHSCPASRSKGVRASLLSASRWRQSPRNILPHCRTAHCPSPDDGRYDTAEGGGGPAGPDRPGTRGRVGDPSAKCPQISYGALGVLN
jgi:hypothetical protein